MGLRFVSGVDAIGEGVMEQGREGGGSDEIRAKSGCFPEFVRVAGGVGC